MQQRIHRALRGGDARGERTTTPPPVRPFALNSLLESSAQVDTFLIITLPVLYQVASAHHQPLTMDDMKIFNHHLHA